MAELRGVNEYVPGYKRWDVTLTDGSAEAVYANEMGIDHRGALVFYQYEEMPNGTIANSILVALAPGAWRGVIKMPQVKKGESA